MNPFPLGFKMKEGSTQTARKKRAKKDLTPGTSDLPPRSAYWASAITEQHELFHIDDWKDAHSTALINDAVKAIADEEINVTTASLNPIDVLSNEKYKLDNIIRKITTNVFEVFKPYAEDRARMFCIPKYQDLANSIIP